MKEAQVKWLAALRSGQYKQGKGRLRSSNDSYCCLGVCYEAGLDREWLTYGPPPLEYRTDTYNLYGLAPDELALLGLDVSAEYDLTVLNDQHSLTFPQIADVLDVYWWGDIKDIMAIAKYLGYISPQGNTSEDS